MRVGIAGFGFMGRMHFAQWGRCAGVEVAAICEQNPDVLGNVETVIGNLPGLPAEIDLSRLRVYADFAEMLEKEHLDAVSITLPTYLHAPISIQALEAGVHVLCEKPMALTADACDAMIAAADRSGRQLMIGHCIRFWPDYVKAKELIDSGCYGEVTAASFRRIGTAPTWSRDNWLKDDKCSGGMALDLHIHDTDFVQFVFGRPRSVCSHVGRQGGRIVHIQTHYIYDDDRVICAEGSWAATPSFGFEMSFTILLERATLVYDCTRQPAFRVCPIEGEAFTPEILPGDGYGHEIAYFAELIAGRNPRPVLTPAQSKESVRIIQAEQQSAREGKRIELV